MNSKALFVNVLTFLRVPLTLLWLCLAILQEYRGGIALALWAGLALFLSGITDLFDGMLARKWNVVSTLGKMADPLMDKIFYVITFPALVWMIVHQGESESHALLMLGFTILYLARDLWVTFMRSIGTMYGGDVAAMWIGKVRTALSFPCAGCVYAYLALHRSLPASWDFPMLVACWAFEIFMIVLTIVSLFTYSCAYAPYLKKALAQK